MKHVLIINPSAGRGDRVTWLTGAAKALARSRGADCSCILTQRPGHAMETCRGLAAAGGETRFYACGGDGTVNEVANGIAGFPNAAMTCVPAGTGNDFLKNFGEEMFPRFSRLEQLWDGPAFPLDAIDCNGRLALTIACSGFDARVARDVHTFGNSRLLPGKGSYIVSLAANFLLRPLCQRWRVYLDGEEQREEEYVLIAACNGRHYGGGFLPVPQARMDDGVLHTMIVTRATRADFLRFVGPYSRGDYHRAPRIARVVTAREVRVEGVGEDVVTCLDGEVMAGASVTLRLSGKRVNFFGPAGCDPNATVRAPAAPPGGAAEPDL